MMDMRRLSRLAFVLIYAISVTIWLSRWTSTAENSTESWSDDVSYDVKQFTQLVGRTLMSIDDKLADPVAVKLVVGTAAQESGLGHYLRQLGNGPAIGAFQMEPATFEWLQAKYQDQYPMLRGRDAYDMEWDLRLAILMCRLRYRAVVFPLPADDIMEIAHYWKRHFNTPLGRGTVNEFVENYRRYIDSKA